MVTTGWPKHVVGYANYNIIILRVCLRSFWLFLIINRQCMVVNHFRVMSVILSKHREKCTGFNVHGFHIPSQNVGFTCFIWTSQ